MASKDSILLLYPWRPISFTLLFSIWPIFSIDLGILPLYKHRISILLIILGIFNLYIIQQ